MFWRLFHRSTIQQYLSDDCWAVVTGSTNGIGQAVADQLLGHGFNVIIHGRSETKIQSVAMSFREKYPQRKVEAVLADLSRLHEVTNIIDAMQGKRVTVFFNNAAATDNHFSLFAEMSEAVIEKTITMGVLFITSLLRKIAPLLARDGPAVCVSIGSASANVACPYIPVYAATKGYLQSLTKSMALEARMTKSPVTYIYADVHSVDNGRNNRTKGSRLAPVPSSQEMAAALISCIGCGKTVVTPYWLHELSGIAVTFLPSSVVENATIGVMQKVIAQPPVNETKVGE